MATTTERAPVWVGHRLTPDEVAAFAADQVLRGGDWYAVRVVGSEGNSCWLVAGAVEPTARADDFAPVSQLAAVAMLAVATGGRAVIASGRWADALIG